jgi:BirA family biotin operon repressor/biotin-[acetyl-CoA-carboxylase] ligase
MSAESDRTHWAIIGFGINGNNAIPPALRSIGAALQELSGAPVDLPGLAAAAMAALERRYGKFLKEGFGPVRKDYLGRFLFMGKKVSVTDPSVRQEGICRGIGEDGSLTVELSGGRTESFFSGDVSLRKV